MNKVLVCLLLPLSVLMSIVGLAQDSSIVNVLPEYSNDSSLVKRTDPLTQNIASALTDSLIKVSADTNRAPIVSKPLSVRSIVIPVALIGYGAITFANKDLQDLNVRIRRVVWEDGNQKHFGIDDFTLAAPVAAVYALNLAGIKGKHNFIDRSALYGMSYFIGTGVVSSVKRLTGVIRPDSSNFYSFPSGHTAQAFIAAEFMRQEYKHKSPWYGIAAYAVAAGTGYLRMYNNKHWFNDVLAGAGIGILSTRVSYWLYPKIKNLFVKEKSGEINTVVMPMYQNGAVGLGLVHRFK